jgi:hypothetical protein
MLFKKRLTQIRTPISAHTITVSRPAGSTGKDDNRIRKSIMAIKNPPGLVVNLLVTGDNRRVVFL